MTRHPLTNFDVSEVVPFNSDDETVMCPSRVGQKYHSCAFTAFPVFTLSEGRL